MKHRANWPEGERSARSRLAQLLHAESFVKASMVRMARTCGKDSCICVTEGKKHVSWYVALQQKGKRRMICIPAEKVEAVRCAVNNYKTITKLVNIVSAHCFERIWNTQAPDNE